MNLTQNEQALLKNYAHSEWNSLNGGDLEYANHFSDLGTFVFLDAHLPSGMNVQEAKGVLGSLVKKGMVDVYSCPSDDDELNFTELGFDTVKELEK